MEALRAGYLLLFAVSAVACYTASWQARRISDRDTRVGLVSLLLLSGTWALASLARLLPYPQVVQQMFYTIGLVLGLATVGAWLYFCSAYAGHEYHHNSRIRMAALTVFVLISTVKLTNPFHHLYFSATTTATPFQHTVLNLHAMHWVVTGVAYALSAIGFYLLYELFSNADLNTSSLTWLVALTGVPAVFDIIAYTELAPSLILKFNYEPVGVAAFAVGVLFVVNEQFVSVPRFWRQEALENLDEGIIVVDSDDRVRNWNRAATELFPGLAGVRGTALAAAIPSLSDLDGTSKILTLERGGKTLHYQVHVRDFSRPNGYNRGRIFTCTDVTAIERQRQELRRQNEQFDDFADAIAHELRNSITIIDGYLKLVADHLVDENPTTDDIPIEVAVEQVERLMTVVEELAIMARLSQPVETVSSCDLRRAVETGLEQSGVDGISYELTADTAVQATEKRLETLFREVFAFLAPIGTSSVRIDASDGTIDILSNGTFEETGSMEQALAYGEPVPSAETGMALPNVRMVTRSLHWELCIDELPDDELRIRIEGVSFS